MNKIIKKSDTNLDPQEYLNILRDIKNRIQQSQVKAVLAVNKELIKLYWYIGQIIFENQKSSIIGSHFIETLAKDLQNAFPKMAGLSKSNLFYMRNFFIIYEKIQEATNQPQKDFLQQAFQQAVGMPDYLPVFSIPWGHNVVLMTKVKDIQECLWYAQQTIENGWSRSILEMQIDSRLFHRQGKIVNNFTATLPSPHSDMVQQTFKDPYIFDFLTLTKDHVERDVELGLIGNVEKMLLELGKGFALVARQYHLEVDEEDYYIDLLFYHTKLKCYVVVELKARDFNPRDVGQLNFYLSAVDDLVRDKDDNPTIGLLLCKTKKNFTAEYALPGVKSPIGVAEYATEIMKKLEKEFENKLPTIAEIEAELEKVEALENLKNKASK